MTPNYGSAIPTVPHRTALVQTLPKHSVGAELGVFDGRWSQVLMDEVEPSLLYLVDVWRKTYQPNGEFVYVPHPKTGTLEDALEATRGRFPRAIEEGRVRILREDSCVAAQRVKDESLDWVYIDGDHTLRGCISDLAVWYVKVKPGGTVMVHDYYSRWDPAVRPAVEAFVRLIGHPALRCTTNGQRGTCWFTKER